MFVAIRRWSYRSVECTFSPCKRHLRGVFVMKWDVSLLKSWGRVNQPNLWTVQFCVPYLFKLTLDVVKFMTSRSQVCPIFIPCNIWLKLRHTCLISLKIPSDQEIERINFCVALPFPDFKWEYDPKSTRNVSWNIFVFLEGWIAIEKKRHLWTNSVRNTSFWRFVSHIQTKVKFNSFKKSTKPSSSASVWRQTGSTSCLQIETKARSLISLF